MTSTAPPTLRFEPVSAAQRGFLEATNDEVLFSGAFGAGKSRVLCEKLVFLAQYYPGNIVLLARKYFSDIKSTTLDTLLREVIPPEHIVQHHRTDHFIDIRTRDPKQTSRIWYRGLDRPIGIGSMSLGAVAVDEALEAHEDDWTMLEGRLRLKTVPFHQIFTATNPGAPSHWLYKRFFQERPIHTCDDFCTKNCTRAGQPVRRVFQTTAYENIHNPPSYHQRLARFTGVHRERYVLGKWVGYEGLVYSDFDPTTHIIAPFTIPPDWRRLRVIDFGTANPFVCQWWANDPRDDTWILYREIYMTNRRATQHAQHILALSGQERIERTLADHDAGDRLDLAHVGVKTQPARKDLEEGLQGVAELLAPRPALVSEAFPRGKPRLLFMRDALVEVDPRLESEGLPTCTTDEFGVYRWAKGTGGTMKDMPKKENDHGMDCCRYLVNEVRRPAKRSWGVG